MPGEFQLSTSHYDFPEFTGSSFPANKCPSARTSGLGSHHTWSGCDSELRPDRALASAILRLQVRRSLDRRREVKARREETAWCPGDSEISIRKLIALKILSD